MLYSRRPRRFARSNRRITQRVSARALEKAPEAGLGPETPAWRTGVRLAGLALLAAGAIYLSTVSVNILVLGTDDVDYAKHTDTIMLLHWQPLTRRLALLSVPRDTLIRLPKRGPMKINAVYAYGSAAGTRDYALAMTRAAVESLLGAKIHYTVHLRYTNFIQVVDALGGVPLYVDKAMHYQDQAGGVNIQLEPGYQLLDGRQALDYVRFRQDRDGDLGRIRRQQNFMKAFVSQLIRFSQLPRTVRAFFIVMKQVETNLSWPVATFLAWELKTAAGGSWRQAILPGHAVYLEGRSYWESDPAAVRKLMAELSSPPKRRAESAPNPTPTAAVKPSADGPAEAEQAESARPAPVPTVRAQRDVLRPPAPPLPSGPQPVVRVLNGCGVQGVAGRVTQRLLSKNIHTRESDVTNAPSFDYARTIIKTRQEHLPWARRIATILGLGDDQIQIIPKNIAYPTVTLVIGKDYQDYLK